MSTEERGSILNIALERKFDRKSEDIVFENGPLMSQGGERDCTSYLLAQCVPLVDTVSLEALEDGTLRVCYHLCVRTWSAVYIDELAAAEVEYKAKRPKVALHFFCSPFTLLCPLSQSATVSFTMLSFSLLCHRTLTWPQV